MNLPANTEHFPPVLSLIQQAKLRALSTVNQQLLELYWQIGEYLSRKVAEQGWGQNVVQQLAAWLATQEPNLRGFSAQNLWRMKQFFETYQGDEKLSPLLRVLSWIHNSDRPVRGLSPRSQAPALIVTHKYFKPRHPGRDCREPEAMDGNAEEAKSFATKDCSIKSSIHIPVSSSIAPRIALDRCSRRDSTSPIRGVVPPASMQSWIPAIPAGMTVSRKHLCIKTKSPAWGRAKYQTRLPDKALLQAKLDEFYELAKLESGQ